MDVEQQRRGCLQAAIDRDASLTQQAASAFLRTSDGKSAVASRLRTRMKKEEEGETKDFTKAPGGGRGPNKLAKRGITAAAPTAPDVEARKEVAQMFVRRRQALTKHDFNATSPPPLWCPRSDCDATFVSPSHYVRHAADVHPADDSRTAELALVMHNPVGLALLESWIGMSANPSETDAHADQEREEKVRFTGEKRETAGDALVLWRTIEDWRTAPSSSDDYKRLGRSILDNKFRLSSVGRTNKKRSDHLPEEVGNALAGLEPVFSLGRSRSLEATNHKNAPPTTHGRPMEQPPSEDAINPLAFEEASWRALVSLNGVVGRAFLTSVPYARYLDEVGRPRREAVEAAAADIAKRKRTESLAEARKLREEAFLRAQERMVDELAENAVTLFLRGTATAATNTGFLGDLVDDQVHARFFTVFL